MVVLTPALLLSSPLSTAESLADPMRPPSVSGNVAKSKGSKAPRWEVTAILVSSGRRLAMVNDQLLGVGGLVDGARIKAIYGNAVELDIEGRAMVIRPAVPSVRQVK
jgi:hypothetical protein